MDYKVQFTKFVQKQIQKLPLHIKDKLYDWAEEVQQYGLPKVQKSSGYHDEPLKGRLQGKRSVRLNQQWRAIYNLTPTNELIFITIERVTPHEYRH